MKRTKKNDRIVYVCKYKNSIVYIGCGDPTRYKHCTSGTSHVLELNRIYFMEGVGDLSVEVVHRNLSQDEALKIEKELIILHKPKFNTVYTVRSKLQDYPKAHKLIMKLLEDYLLDNFTGGYQKLENRINDVKDIIRYFTYTRLLAGEPIIYTSTALVSRNGTNLADKICDRNRYPQTGLSKIFKIVRTSRTTQYIKFSQEVLQLLFDNNLIDESILNASNKSYNE